MRDLKRLVELAVDVGGDGQPAGLRGVIWSTPKRAPGAFFRSRSALTQHRRLKRPSHARQRDTFRTGRPHGTAFTCRDSALCLDAMRRISDPCVARTVCDARVFASSLAQRGGCMV